MLGWVGIAKGLMPFARYVAAPVATVAVIWFVAAKIERNIEDGQERAQENERLRTQVVVLSQQLSQTQTALHQQGERLSDLGADLSRARREAAAQRFDPGRFPERAKLDPGLTEQEINDYTAEVLREIERVANEGHR